MVRVTRAAFHPDGCLSWLEGALAIHRLSAGSQLEGGGQILRNAAALAALTATPIRISAIRAGRTPPGLRPQHVAGLDLVARLCDGALEGATVGSTCASLSPQAGYGPGCGGSSGGGHGEVLGEAGTAASCMLMAQAALPCLLLPRAMSARGPPPGRRTLRLRGGTDARAAPPADYLRHVLAPALRAHAGVDLEVEVLRRGFFPKGGGEVACRVAPLSPGSSLPPLRLTQRGEVRGIVIRAFQAGRVPRGVADRMARAARAALGANLATLVEAEEVEALPPCQAVGDGCGVLLAAHTSSGCVLGASGLGERGVSAEAVGRRAGAELAALLASGACVDAHAADQLVIFAAMAGGESRLLMGEPTLHTLAAIAVAEQLTAARFDLQTVEGLTLMACHGAGLTWG
ncbi:hypothetical protein ACKKBG_A35605 [Auxenochlorella protothecoides x Auxenochlorella symbiontica]